MFIVASAVYVGWRERVKIMAAARRTTMAPMTNILRLHRT
jgi:hypothetical protein